jgi:hypothetical protein
MEVPIKTGSLRRRSAYIEVLPVKKVMLIFLCEKYRNKRNAVRTQAGQGFQDYGTTGIDVRCKEFTGCARDRNFFLKNIFLQEVPLYGNAKLTLARALRGYFIGVH